VFILQNLPKFLGGLHTLIDIEQGISHAIQNDPLANVVIILKLWSTASLLQSLILDLSRQLNTTTMKEVGENIPTLLTLSHFWN